MERVFINISYLGLSVLKSLTFCVLFTFGSLCWLAFATKSFSDENNVIYQCMDLTNFTRTHWLLILLIDSILIKSYTVKCLDLWEVVEQDAVSAQIILIYYPHLKFWFLWPHDKYAHSEMVYCYIEFYIIIMLFLFFYFSLTLSFYC